MQISPEFTQILKDVGGVRANGQPKFRIRTPEEAVYPHGKLWGQPKYRNPETGKPMNFLVLEMWIPPAMYPSRDTWPYELMGPYPVDCSCPHCDNAMWGLKTPLTNLNGEFLPISYDVMEFIKRIQYFDMQWAAKTPKEQLDELDAIVSRAQTKRDAEATREIFKSLEVYATNKEKEDNADNRVFSFGDEIAPEGKNIKMPVGSPLIK
jgi:hypothetical protein